MLAKYLQTVCDDDLAIQFFNREVDEIHASYISNEGMDYDREKLKEALAKFVCAELEIMCDELEWHLRERGSGWKNFLESVPVEEIGYPHEYEQYEEQERDRDFHSV